ncbi:aminoglycoside phosphotransferase [Candidatus Methylomirabilis lanthanidiphila]|uniref:Aminoglycoside phosphotransferase n=1 Tax=Candidatus Methylomirabilis lanthanidiphila TaxID=2211376 RepID=A0A564ZMM2_9BACT|nr:aminoglycoside phosphotransferase family protein [Candidatus Methylomirabilis lanthanidiphila]VUZ85798.1 aminoglycoside phosphotransferase [Candidatus Methylomirabilis lanthanidiphila]
MTLQHKALAQYLEAALGGVVQVQAVRPITGDESHVVGKEPGVLHGHDLKAFGYGRPIQIDLLLNGVPRSYVLSTMRGGRGFGHDHKADRAGALIWAHEAYGKLARHVESIDVGFFTRDGQLQSAGRAEEYFLLVDKVEGATYRLDLERILAEGNASKLDFDRARALSDYLAKIHAEKEQDEQLYFRRIRDLIGHGEGIMGILDGYPTDYPLLPSKQQYVVECGCVAWRQCLKEKSARLSIVHGDFHPWNILFREGTDFTLLDRSRGEWGEPADDIAALSINFLFFSLLRSGRLEGPFQALFDCFYGGYLERTRDLDLNSVIPPFYVFRALVIASPRWYPDLPEEVRIKLLRFVQAMLRIEQFDHKDLNRYLL